MKESIKDQANPLFAWLPGTMDEEEMVALTKAVQQLNCKIIIDEKGYGEVIK